MNKTKRIAIAYLVSILVNGLFWLAYARELRQASANVVTPKPESARRLKPMVLGQFKPLPPLPRKEPKPPAILESKKAKETTGKGKEVSANGKKEASQPRSESLEGQREANSAADGGAAPLASGAAQDSSASQTGAPQPGSAASHAAPQPGQVARGGGAPSQTGQKSQAGGHAALLRMAQADPSSLNGEKVASAQTPSESLSQREDQSPNASSNDMAAPSAVGAKAQAGQKALKQLSALKAGAAADKAGDDKEGQDSKTPEPEKAKADTQPPPKPGNLVALKVIKMWTPKPGQKFNLATSLNIVLPPTLELVPGPPLTPEQLEQVQKLLRQQKLKHVSLNRKQLKKLIEAQRIAENTKKPDKPGDEGRKRIANREAHQPHPPHPHTALAHTPITPKMAMARPRSPFTYKQWNSDMYKRWQPIEAASIQDTPPPAPPANANNAASTNSAADPNNAADPNSTAPLPAPPNAASDTPPAAPRTGPDNPARPARANHRGGTEKAAPLDTAAPAGATQTGRRSEAREKTKGGILTGTPPDTKTGTPGANPPPAVGNPGAPANPAPAAGGQPGANGNPPANTGQPGQAGATDANPGQPGGQQGQPGVPGANGNPPANAGQPGAPGAAGNPPAGNAGNPPGNQGNPGGQPGVNNPANGNPGPVNAGQPNQPGANAGNPGVPGNPPDNQGGAPANPGQAGNPGQLGNPPAAGNPGNPGGQPNPTDTNTGQPGNTIGQPNQPGANAGNPGVNAGNPGANQGQPGNVAGQPNQPGNLAGQPGANQGQPGANQGQPGANQGQPGANQGQPGANQGQPGANQGQPGANAGQPGPQQGQPGAMAGQPGGQQGQPGNLAGQPGANGNPPANAGQPGAMAGQPGGQQGQPGGQQGQPGGQPGAMPGQPGGQPGNMAGQPGGQPGTQPGQPGGQPGAMAGQPGGPPGQPGGQPGAMAGPPGNGAGGQPGDATQAGNLDATMMASADGGAGGVLSGEQADGMSDLPPAQAENTEATGFDTPANANSSPDLPPDPVGDGKKGIPGSLVLPPSPPMGTETGKDPTPHAVKTNILTRPTGKTATPVSPVTEMTPTSREVPPRKLVPSPFGMPKKTAVKVIPPALTVGSTSARGTVLVAVMERPHLALGTVTDTIDPPLPPAKGAIKSQTQAPKQEAVREQKSAQTPPPTESAKPTESVKKTPAIVRQVKNSQGIKDGTLQPLPPTPMPDSDMEVGDGSGLKGDYFLGRKFDQFQFTKADANINFKFDSMPDGSPSPKIPRGSDYTIRWTGKIAAKYSETYTFYATADDGVRVWINHRLLIDDWSLHAVTEFSNKFRFTAGEQYPIKVEYLESAGGFASVQLYWSSPSQPKTFIPEDAFFYPLPSDEEELKQDKAPL